MPLFPFIFTKLFLKCQIKEKKEDINLKVIKKNQVLIFYIQLSDLFILL